MLILPLGKEGSNGIQFFTLLIISLCILMFAITGMGHNTLWLAYYPESYNPLYMLSSAFCHGDIIHITGNLFFFFCFASTVEKSSTSFGFFFCFLVFVFIPDIAYSISTYSNIPTIGLSGVVWGYMGVFLALYPTSNVKCLVWYLIIIKKIEVPSFIFILAFLAFDIGAAKNGVISNVNYVAHFAGFGAGVITKLFIWPLLEKKKPSEKTAIYHNKRQRKW